MSVCMDKISQSKNELENIKILLDRKSKEIEIIKQISNQINKSLDLNLIASSMLSLMNEFFGFKHSMILLVSENKKHLNVLETYGYEKRGIGAKVEFGVGVIGIVAEKTKLMRMANLGMQRSYMQAIREQVQITNKNKLQDKVELPGLKNAESQVAIPMLIDNELVGVFSVESEKMNIFDKSDEILIGILANQTASALENARLYQLEQKRLKELNKAHQELESLNINLEKKVEERTSELKTLSEKLSKYFSPQVYESIFSGKLDVKVQTKRKPLTVFFSDLQGFTELTERLEPEVLTELLTQYLTKMSNVAIKWGGTIDKFIGDAILVFFGDPNSRGDEEDAIACVSMAMDMLEELNKLRISWRKKGLAKPLNARMGIHTGVCTVGNFGSEDRLDYTIIGNGVNLASRLEARAGINKILLSEDTYLLIRNKIICEKKEAINVKGISYPVQTYEVVKFSQENENLIERNIPGLSLSIDKSEIEDNKIAIKVVSEVLKDLKSKS